MTGLDLSVTGTVISGHGVASGKARDPRFPGGTLAMQRPYFANLGLELSDYYLATLNVSIQPLDFRITEAEWQFNQVAWHPVQPAENFSFVKIAAESSDFEGLVFGLIYYPHPETKPDHFQPDGMMEIMLTDYIESIDIGTELTIRMPSSQIELIGYC